jgi:hypothetical protein
MIHADIIEKYRSVYTIPGRQEAPKKQSMWC